MEIEETIENLNTLSIIVKIPKDSRVCSYKRLLDCKDFAEYEYTFKLKMNFCFFQIISLLVEIKELHSNYAPYEYLTSTGNIDKETWKASICYYFAYDKNPARLAVFIFNCISLFLGNRYYIKPLKGMITASQLENEEAENTDKRKN